MAETVKKEKLKKNKKNAVLYKEMTVDMKRPKVMLTILIVNLILIPVTLCFFIGIYFGGLADYVYYRLLAWYFIAIVYSEMTILLFITPAITAGCISLEKERQCLDVLLTTRMTTWEIIKGKFASEFVFLGLIVISTFPVLSIVFLYGGISLLNMFYVGLALLVFVAFLQSIGVFFSTLTKNTVVSVILSYIFVVSYLTLTIGLPFILLGIVAAVNEELYYNSTYFANITSEHFINGDFLFLSGAINPLFMFFDVIGNAIGYDFGEVSFSGMSALAGTELMPHFTEKNILFKLFTPLSMAFELLVSFILLRVSGAMLNPVKGKRKKRK